jgi:ribosomal protein L11 methyltransferase
VHLLTLAVRPGRLEEALDVLLPRFPDGVHVVERDAGPEVLVYGAEPPDPAAAEPVRELLRSAPKLAEAPEDWRERRRERYVPHTYGGRLVVRPAWAPPPDAGLLDLVLDGEHAAFGSGEHPTTRACLELLCQLPPEDHLADLGCGSGVVAVAAALLGWRRVSALDVDQRSVLATAENALRNGVEVETATADLTRDPVPGSTLAVANVPAWVHERLAGRLTSRTVVATGIEAPQRPAVVAAYEAAGYAPVVVEDLMGWTLLVAEAVRR